jgi:hypothetical protein
MKNQNVPFGHLKEFSFTLEFVLFSFLGELSDHHLCSMFPIVLVIGS